MSGIVPVTSLPADVRTGTPQQKQTYEAAVGFESMLLSQLTQSLADSAGLTGADASGDGSGDDSSDGSSDPAVSAYGDMLPTAMANAVIGAGGTGLAENIYRAIQPEAGK
jgi:Rod binding domain-containing protein